MRVALTDSDISMPKSSHQRPSATERPACARGGADDVRATLTVPAQYSSAAELQYRRIVLDNNVLKTLVKPANLVQFRRQASLTAMHVWPTAINVYEAAQTRDAGVRASLIAQLRDLAPPGFSILPAPFDLLRLTGRAVVNGDARFPIERASADTILRAPDVAERRSAAVRASLSRIATRFDAAYARRREMVFGEVKGSGLSRTWSSTGDFLETAWRGSEMEASAVHLLWEGIRMHGEPPVAALLQCETWRMNSDVEGAAFYERVIAHEQPRRTDRLDWQQLPYLGLAEQRILLTDDGPFNISARGILRAYPGTRVMTIADYLDS